MVSRFFGLIDIIRFAVGNRAAPKALAQAARSMTGSAASGRVVCASVAFASILLIAGPARAQFTYTWTGHQADGAWNHSGNWSSSDGGTGFPGASDTADFTDSSGSKLTIKLSTTDAISVVNVTGTLGYTWSSGTLTMGNSFNYGSSGSSTFSGILAGAGNLTVSAGTLTLSGANTYTGGTTVTSGTLSVANSSGSATGTGNVTVSSGGVLSGSSTGGTITLGSGNSVTINSGGTLSPGIQNVSVGALTISGNTSFASGSTFAWNINNAAPASAANNSGGSDSAGKQDLLTSSGALTLGTINFAVNEVTTMTLNSNSTYSWKVATYTGTAPSTSGVTFNTANAPGIRAYLAAHSDSLISLVASGGALYLNLAPTPEPQHILFICLGAIGVALFIRRRWLSVAVSP
jgi:autotransporter-associated beta strand protein